MERVEGAVEYKLTYDKIINYFNKSTTKQGNAVKARRLTRPPRQHRAALYVAMLVVDILLPFSLSQLLLLSLLPLSNAFLCH